MREAEPFVNRGQLLQMSMQCTRERGQLRHAALRVRGERARIRRAKLLPDAPPDVELLGANRLAAFPEQAQRLRRQLPDSDEARRARKIVRSDELEPRRRSVLGEPR